MAAKNSQEIRRIVCEVVRQLPPRERLAYSITDAAEALGIPRNTLRDHVADGRIPSVKRCGRRLILRDDLLAWLRDNN